MAELKITPDQVIASMNEMRKKLDAINKHNDSLNRALLAYKAQFEDEISEESSKLVHIIQMEIKRLNEEYEKYRKQKQDTMVLINDWRKYR